MSGFAAVEAEPAALGSDAADAVDGIAVARLYGEPLFALPTDLYIPPDALEVFLEAFEGPLDLLLYLIRKQNFNILDIPMASVTRQYLAYVEQIRRTNLELASDYLLMAAMLIEIKSRMLLPPKQDRRRQGGRGPARRAGAPPGRVRADEAGRRAPRRAAAARPRLPARPGARSTTPWRPRLPDVAPADLREAWTDLVRRASLVQHHRISREQLQRARAHEHPAARPAAAGASRFRGAVRRRVAAAEVMVVTFIALLELAREHLIEVTQAEAFAPIYVRLAYQTS